MKDIVITVKLGFSELIKLRFKAAYRTPFMLFFTAIGVGMLWTVVSHINGAYSGSGNSFPVLQAIFAIFFLIVFPVSIVRSAQRDLISNKFISQTIEYTFKELDFTMTGETFSMRNEWTDLHKIVEFNEWFVLYTSRTEGLFIPKNRFEDLQALDNFKEILKTLNINKQLK